MLLRRLRTTEYLPNSEIADIERHFHNILRVFVAGGLPTHIDLQKLKKIGFGSFINLYRSSTVKWSDFVSHPKRTIECTFSRSDLGEVSTSVPGEKRNEEYSKSECEQSQKDDDSIAWQIQMPSLKTEILFSERLKNTLPHSDAVPLQQALSSVGNINYEEKLLTSEEQSPLDKIRALRSRLLASGGVPDHLLDNGINLAVDWKGKPVKATDGGPTKKTFFGLRRAEIARAAEKMLSFPMLASTGNRTLESNAEALTTEIIIVARFVQSKGGTTQEDVVGIHLLIDGISVFRRGLIRTVKSERKSKRATCFSIPILVGFFGIDLCVGVPRHHKNQFVYSKWSKVGYATEHVLVKGSGEHHPMILPFDVDIGMRVVIGTQLVGTPLFSMASATIPIHPFMSEMLGGCEGEEKKREEEVAIGSNAKNGTMVEIEQQDIELCWIKMPTGCAKTLKLTKTPQEWFSFLHSRNRATCMLRVKALNKYCDKEDCKTSWGRSPPQEIYLERGFSYGGVDLQRFSNVSTEEDAQRLFLTHPEADMYVYGLPSCDLDQWCAGLLLLKKAPAFDQRSPMDVAVAGFRSGRGSAAYEQHVQTLEKRYVDTN